MTRPTALSNCQQRSAAPENTAGSTVLRELETLSVGGRGAKMLRLDFVP